MRRRYAVKTGGWVRAYDEDWYPSGSAGSVTVYVDEGGDFASTGLVDANGDEILMRIREPKCPIGFLWHDADGELRRREWFTEDEG